MTEEATRPFCKGDRVKPSPRAIAGGVVKPHVRGVVVARPLRQSRITVQRDGTRSFIAYASFYWLHDDSSVVE